MAIAIATLLEDDFLFSTSESENAFNGAQNTFAASTMK